MQFNEFQKRLRDANVSPQLAYLMSHMFEVQIEFSRQLDQLGTLLVETLDKVAAVTVLTEEDRKRVKALLAGRQEPGVEVGSVVNDPYEEK